jgi:ribosomal subunit interface protein
MLVQVIGDNHIRGGQDLSSYVQTTVESQLARFSKQITRVEVHLADENSHKNGTSDKSCSLRVHVAGLQDVGATAHGGTIDQALDAALEKLVAQLDHKLGRLGERKGRASMGDQPNEET